MTSVGAGTSERDDVKDENALSKLTLNSDVDRCTDGGVTKSGSTGVESSLRCCYLTEYDITGDHPSTSGGVSWGRSYSRPLPLDRIHTVTYSTSEGNRSPSINTGSRRKRNHH